jgi:hypothetical protein
VVNVDASGQQQPAASSSCCCLPSCALATGLLALLACAAAWALVC